MDMFNLKEFYYKPRFFQVLPASKYQKNVVIYSFQYILCGWQQKENSLTNTTEYYEGSRLQRRVEAKRKAFSQRRPAKYDSLVCLAVCYNIPQKPPNRFSGISKNFLGYH